jgi:hypothetical protein
MLFIDERNAVLAAAREEWPPPFAIANGLNSTKTVASVIIEIFIVICHFLFLLVLW